MFKKISLLCLLLAACGEDKKQEENNEEPTPTENPVPQEPQNELLGEPSPILKDTELWYNLLSSLRRQNNSDGEVQTNGSICLRVSEVQDTATKFYQNQPQTLIKAFARATSPTGDKVFFTSDLNSPTATPQEVDALLQNLWLKRLSLPSANHGYEDPKSVLFQTQTAPLKTADFTALPFFEVRQLGNWQGFTNLKEVEGGDSFLNRMYAYFLAPPFGPEFFTNEKQFKYKQIIPSSSCKNFATAEECPLEGCTWTVPAGGNQSACLSLHGVRLIWRETLVDPVELAGPVVHQLELQYTHEGILLTANEMIVPDATPQSNLPSQVFDCSKKCLSASVANAGSFKDNAPCRFE